MDSYWVGMSLEIFFKILCLKNLKFTKIIITAVDYSKEGASQLLDSFLFHRRHHQTGETFNGLWSSSRKNRFFYFFSGIFVEGAFYVIFFCLLWHRFPWISNLIIFSYFYFSRFVDHNNTATEACHQNKQNREAEKK